MLKFRTKKFIVLCLFTIIATLLIQTVVIAANVGDLMEERNNWLRIPDGSAIKQISVGDNHVLALLDNGDLYGWGSNTYGQLGVNTATETGVPVLILKEVSSMSAGANYSMAIKTDGTLWGWGHNDYGQIGNGTKANSLTPVQVSGLNGLTVTQVDAGISHTLALTSDDTLYTWGNNNYGQLGNNTTTNSSRPVKASITGVVQVSAGTYHSMAVTGNGNLYGWGYNKYGQIGDGTVRHKSSPTRVELIKSMKSYEYLPVQSVSAGDNHTVAITTDGDVYVWGRNQRGQLGVNTTSAKRRPIRAFGDASYVVASSDYTLILKDSGELYSCGQNDNGQLATGSLLARKEFVKVLGSVSLVAAGKNTVVVATDLGQLWGWGDNASQKLGVTNKIASKSLVPAIILTTGFTDPENTAVVTNEPTTLQSTNYFSMTIIDNTLYAWGSNKKGQLGICTVREGKERHKDHSVIEKPIIIMQDVESFSIGNNHTMVLKSNGELWGWGHNKYGQLGLGYVTSQPIYSPVKIMDDIAAVSAGKYFTLVLRKDGSLWGWGHNKFGQLGTIGNRLMSGKLPGIQIMPVKMMDGVAEISAGSNYSMAIKTDGTLWGWGYNVYNQLGNNVRRQYTTPAFSQSPIKIMDGVKKVSSGIYHTMALKINGELWGWGYNKNGQLGDGTVATKHYPVKIMNDVAQVSAGMVHTVAVNNDGDLYVWGYTFHGEVNSRKKQALKLFPEKVASDVMQATAGNHCTIYIDKSGKYYSWGASTNGQLGTGSDTSERYPVIINSLSINIPPEPPVPPETTEPLEETTEPPEPTEPTEETTEPPETTEPTI